MRNIFSLKTKSIEKETPDDVQLSSRRSNETYQQWGTRWAGQTNADVQALRPALQVVILQQKKEQAGDQQLQEEEKLKKRNEIAVLDAQKESQQNNLSMISSKIDSLETEKNDKQSEIDAIKASDNKNNIATVNFWIGLFITLLLAAYLFIFYSSASYSAFFRAGDSLDTGSAIFIQEHLMMPGKLGLVRFC